MRYAVLLSAIVGCAKPAPTPTPTIYTTLVQAGCLDPNDDAGLSAVQRGLLSDAQPPWFACLADGGTVAGCGVPCE